MRDNDTTEHEDKTCASPSEACVESLNFDSTFLISTLYSIVLLILQALQSDFKSVGLWIFPIKIFFVWGNNDKIKIDYFFNINGIKSKNH